MARNRSPSFSLGYLLATPIRFQALYENDVIVVTEAGPEIVTSAPDRYGE